MKKLVSTTTALVFALGLTAAVQAQPAVDKPAPAPVQKVTETAPQAIQTPAAPEATKVAAPEAKKAEKALRVKKHKRDKAGKCKEASEDVGQKTGAGLKTPVAPDKKAEMEVPQAEKK
ncbi:hypothetical protein [Desulfobacca acetoxidans]|uniref:Protein tyrosine phosphatase, receptor type, F n=1 Tax=Desulfobacca acetoxidans (strain ATCC 700848 / DSM 11109 / ASRB2) TaxID=880072 RepID=F2NIM2_DESAR|nr:hypothetical protein [Desulfobacca acetoxidans]AEB10497.1 protein tyrosine phosphatase, receptor type, F [Desulfobacca acetoxidans DSM 11109]